MFGHLHNSHEKILQFNLRFLDLQFLLLIYQNKGKKDINRKNLNEVQIERWHIPEIYDWL